MSFWKDVICCCFGSGGGGTVLGCGDLSSCSTGQGDIYHPIDISVVHELKFPSEWQIPDDELLNCQQPCTTGSGCGCFMPGLIANGCEQIQDTTQFSELSYPLCSAGQPSSGCTNGEPIPGSTFNMPCDGSPASGSGVDCVGSCFPAYDQCVCDDSDPGYQQGACGKGSVAIARLDEIRISGTGRCTVIPSTGHPNPTVTGTQTQVVPTGSPCVGFTVADLSSDLGAAFYTTQTSYQELKWDGLGPGADDCDSWSGLCGYAKAGKFMCVDALKTCTYGRPPQNIRYLTTAGTVSVDVPPAEYGPVLDLNAYSDAFVCTVSVRSESMSHWELLKDNGWGSCYSSIFNPGAGDEGPNVSVTFTAGMIAQKSAGSLKFTLWGYDSTTPLDSSTYTKLNFSCKGFEIPGDFSQWTAIP